MTVLSRADLVALPKAHLHLHLEGSARPATIRQLAERAGTDAPVFDGFATFADFDRLYLEMLDLITGPEDLGRICRELVEDEAGAGVRYLEPSINPTYWAERFDISATEALAVMHDAFAEAGEPHGMEVGLMVGCPRDIGVGGVEAMARFAADHADAGVVSLGMCGSEPDDAHRPLRRACDVAREAGLLIVPHAGEQRGPESVRTALDELAPDRIAHGFRATEDPAVLAELAERGITCDVCPSSNVGIGVVPSLAEHPLPVMRAAGVPVSLGSDDSLFFGVDLVHEYDLAQCLYGAGPEDLAQIARDAARASGARPDTVAAILADVDAWERDVSSSIAGVPAR